MRAGLLQTAPLLTQRIKFEDSASAYLDALSSGGLGVLLEYSSEGPPSLATQIPVNIARPPIEGNLEFGLVGVGNYAVSTFLPALQAVGANLGWIVDHDGARALSSARRFGAKRAGTDHEEVLADPDIAAVFFLVRHDQHASLVCDALGAQKHVFVEKPLVLNEEELYSVVEATRKAPSQILMVGFNRRIQPHIAKCRELLTGRAEPLAMTITVNAGSIPIELGSRSECGWGANHR